MALTNTSNYIMRLIEGTEMGSTWRYYFWKLLEWGYFLDWLIRMKIRSSLTQLVSGSYVPWHHHFFPLHAFLLSDLFLPLISALTGFHDWGLVTRWAQLLITSNLPSTPKDRNTMRTRLDIMVGWSFQSFLGRNVVLLQWRINNTGVCATPVHNIKIVDGSSNRLITKSGIKEIPKAL